MLGQFGQYLCKLILMKGKKWSNITKYKVFVIEYLKRQNCHIASIAPQSRKLRVLTHLNHHSQPSTESHQLHPLCTGECILWFVMSLMTREKRGGNAEVACSILCVEQRD